MHTRIKYLYEGAGDNVMAMSKQNFMLNGRELTIYLYINDFKFEIVDANGAVVTKGGNTKNVAVLKKQAKRALARLGYEFGAETRNRGNNETENQDSINGV